MQVWVWVQEAGSDPRGMMKKGRRLHTASSPATRPNHAHMHPTLPAQVPKSIVIIGGGYIAVEFAGIFAGLGSEVRSLGGTLLARAGSCRSPR